LQSLNRFSVRCYVGFTSRPAWLSSSFQLHQLY
jgi:hypothetical protein